MDFYTNCYADRDQILIRYVKNGKRSCDQVNYKPYLFVQSGKPQAKYSTITGSNADKVLFPSIKQARDFIRTYKDVSGLKLFGLQNFEYLYLYDMFARGGKPIQYNVSDIVIATLDIEVAADDGFPSAALAEKPITAITIRVNDQLYVFGCGDFKTADPKIKYFKCKDEKALLVAFLEIWQSINPDVVTGWNIEGFDIPYLINRLTFILGPAAAKGLSPWRKLSTRKVFIFNKEVEIHSIVGISVLDYLSLYKKFTYSQQESYKLDHIAFVELGQKKLDYSEHGSLLQLYKNDFQKFIEYNIHDVNLVYLLEQKMRLLELVFAMAYDAGVNYNDVLGTVKLWDVLIHNYLLDRRIVIDPLEIVEQGPQIQGAYVKVPLVGRHKWIVSFDLTSLYPRLIIQYNISPDTLAGIVSPFPTVEQLLSGTFDLKQDYSYAANGSYYKRDKQGFLPALMEHQFNLRTQYKKQMLEAQKLAEKDPAQKDLVAKFNNAQMAKKIQLNSLYGALSNRFFRWYDRRLAEAVTISGQLTIRWAEKIINMEMNRILSTDSIDYVVAIDTDSVHLCLDSVVKANCQNMTKSQICDWLDNYAKTVVEPILANGFGQLATMMNVSKNEMHMKREAIADVSIWTSKKHYIQNVLDNEGVRYAKPKMKILGLEAVKSSTPQFCRDIMKQLFTVMIEQENQQLIDAIKQIRLQYKTKSFEQIAFPRSINGLTTYEDQRTIYKPSTPIHVRGALLYNRLLKQLNLEKKYPKIYEGDKIKFCYLKIPNPIHENVIAVPDSLPTEFKLDNYIDYDLQFDKTLLGPIKHITDTIGWHIDNVSSLEEFF